MAQEGQNRAENCWENQPNTESTSPGSQMHSAQFDDEF